METGNPREGSRRKENSERPDRQADRVVVVEEVRGCGAQRTCPGSFLIGQGVSLVMSRGEEQLVGQLDCSMIKAACLYPSISTPRHATPRPWLAKVRRGHSQAKCHPRGPSHTQLSENSANAESNSCSWGRRAATTAIFTTWPPRCGPFVPTTAACACSPP